MVHTTSHSTSGNSNTGRCDAVFSSLQFSFDTNIPSKLKSQLKAIIQCNGGKVNDFVTSKVNFLVSDTSGGYKRYSATKLNISVVPESFIHECVTARKLLDVQPWAIKDTPTNTEDALLKFEPNFLGTSDYESDKITTSGTYLSPSGNVQYEVPSYKTKDLSRDLDEATLIRPSLVRDYKSSDDLATSFPPDFEIAKVDIFHKNEGVANALFAVVELHTADQNSVDGKDLSSFKHHARVFFQQGTRQSVSEVTINYAKCIYCQDIVEAEAVYSYKYYEFLEKENFCKTSLLNILDKEEGLKHAINQNYVPSSIKTLVDNLYNAATANLKTLLDSPIGTISLDTVEKAIPILLQIQNSPDEAAGRNLKAEFMALIPGSSVDFTRSESLESALEQLQNMVDLLRVKECEGNAFAVSDIRYRSMNCNLEVLAESSEEHSRLSRGVNVPNVCVKRIFKIHRTTEHDQFSKSIFFIFKYLSFLDIGNVRQLFHGTKSESVFGILSRGFLIPNYEELTKKYPASPYPFYLFICLTNRKYGVQRTHFSGLLGYGIYFADQFSVSHTYTTEAALSRFILVADVALGNCKSFYSHDTSRVIAPDGYDSAHGVKSTTSRTSAFQDDEYVVYNTSQIVLKYLIEYGPKTSETSFVPKTIEENRPIMLSAGPSLAPATSMDIDDAITNNTAKPANLPKLGLLSNSGVELPLKSVFVKAKILDLASEVVLFQKFRNESDVPVECKYVFELANGCAVCGFEAFIKGKHIIGKVEEKKQAHAKYKKAVETGKRAYPVMKARERKR